ncbi:MAG: carbohydrate binding domain-containing protein [Verrucomicrobiae bacterium]|nr:carbohydrate binding domain-containing protein [Verrucomicrobiae bacterium]
MKIAQIGWLGLILTAATVAPGEEGTEVSSNDFESLQGLAAWPAGTPLHLDSENPKSGRSSIQFMPATGCSAYWYVKLEPETKYRIKLFYRMDRPTLPRHGILFQFSKRDGETGGLGSVLFSFDKESELVADDQWHEMVREFVTPAETQSCRLQLAFYRTPSTVNIDALTLSLLGPASKEGPAKTASAPPPATPPSPAATPKEFEFSNGDFEAGTAGWSPWFKPEQAQWRIDEAEKRSGKASVLIEGTTPGRHFLVRTIEGIKPKATYKVAFWVKTEGFTTGDAAVTCDLEPVNAKPRPYCDLAKMRGSQPWQLFEFYVEVPEGARKARLCLIHASGKIWFDDITFAEEKE